MTHLFAWVGAGNLDHPAALWLLVFLPLAALMLCVLYIGFEVCQAETVDEGDGS